MATAWREWGCTARVAPVPVPPTAAVSSTVAAQLRHFPEAGRADIAGHDVDVMSNHLIESKCLLHTYAPIHVGI